MSMEPNSAPTRGDTGSALAEGTRSPGRPTLLTPERTEAMLTHVRAGLPLRTACTLAGFSYDTFKVWQAAGRAGDPHFAPFLTQLEEARAVRQQTLLRELEDSGRHQWQSRAWILARSFPEDWAEQSTRTVRHEGSALTVNVVNVASPDLVGVMRILQQAGALPSGEVVDGTVVSTESDSE